MTGFSSLTLSPDLFVHAKDLFAGAKQAGDMLCSHPSGQSDLASHPGRLAAGEPWPRPQGATSPPHCNRNEKMRGISGRGHD